MQNDSEIKILFIGLDGAGKTSIIYKIKINKIKNKIIKIKI